VRPIYRSLVDYEDRISVLTPEGVTLDVPLAGVGSRFVAVLLDQVLQVALLVALFFLLVWSGGAGIAEESVALAYAVFTLLAFVVQFGYHVAFETWASGRTPGKRWTGLRVVKESGAPVDFTSSAVRNVLRLVDMLPFAYGVGIVAVLASSKNQRLGDMAADTLVVRERTGGRQTRRERKQLRRAGGASAPIRPEPSPEALTWDVSAVTGEELATVRNYLERRLSLRQEARLRLAAELAGRLRPKVVGPDPAMPDLDFLTELEAVKSTRG
jgi:uncharacterized RDD family membrane protein YckC